ncbi:hypothetical protein KXD40_006462 [Peronospora effusa]|uniref:Uncharacterized protein n=1 Tax=Peronospora effusa TaxID=542832 RepID=A0A3M6VS67_9STRA|nr:hypothetical protein DD238_004667 [Peronospora effusa]UIZ25858.1 hypothetical protein KXD40_006462 [Peronospora effusa]
MEPTSSLNWPYFCVVDLVNSPKLSALEAPVVLVVSWLERQLERVPKDLYPNTMKKETLDVQHVEYYRAIAGKSP